MGQKRQRYVIFLGGFGWGGLCACVLHWVDLVDLGEELSRSVKIF